MTTEKEEGAKSGAPGGAVPDYMRGHLLYVHPRPWRVGRKVARNVYDANSEGVAMFTHAYTAAIVVAAVNGFSCGERASQEAGDDSDDAP